MRPRASSSRLYYAGEISGGSEAEYSSESGRHSQATVVETPLCYQDGSLGTDYVRSPVELQLPRGKSGQPERAAAEPDIGPAPGSGNRQQ